MEEFEKGTPDGVAIASDGQLRQGPGLTEQLTTPSTFVWALVADKAGQVLAGTGTPASVLRLAGQRGEEPFILFETKDLSVQALCLGPDGALYAATLPSGKVYRLNRNATEQVIIALVELVPRSMPSTQGSVLIVDSSPDSRHSRPAIPCQKSDGYKAHYS